MGRVDRKERGWGGVDGNGDGGQGGGIWKGAGVDGEGSNRDGKGVTTWRGQCEEEMERGAMGKGGGEMGSWQWGGGKGERGGDGEGEMKGQEEGKFHRWI